MKQTEILCIGSVLWDVIGRAAGAMRQGADMPGRITRLPGGVALNIAVALARFGLRPVLLSAVGRDPEGDALLAACDALGLDTGHVLRLQDMPTDRYMAIEAANGLIAAIADAHSLEAAGAQILRPLADGALGTAAAPYAGLVALDGNLTHDLLDWIARDQTFGRADLRVAPASPGKAARLLPFLTHGRAVLYVNLEEAGILCGQVFRDSASAAAALIAAGAQRALVTDGSGPATDADARGAVTLAPPQVRVARVTGAGDTFIAAHIAAEVAGCDRAAALGRALNAAATYVSGEMPQ